MRSPSGAARAVDHAIVAIDDAADPAFADVVPGAAAIGEGVLADARRIRPVKSFDELQREPSLRGERAAAWFCVEELGERTIGAPVRVETAHDRVELFPEVIEDAELRTRDRPPFPADVDAREACLVEDLVELRSASVDELGAELDGNGRAVVADV